jgi:hypothetical protein
MDIQTLFNALDQLGIMPIFMSVMGIAIGMKILSTIVKSIGEQTTFNPSEEKEPEPRPEPQQPVIYRIQEPAKEPERPHCAWCGYYYPKNERHQRGTCPRCGAPNMFAK